jgi:uncharacterized protein (TIGR02270 family)
LADLDDRLDAHLDGLRVAGKDVWAVGAETLSLDDPGAVFAHAQLALSTGRLDQLANLLDLAAAPAPLARALLAALAWSRLELVGESIGALLDASCPPVLRRLGLGAAAAHRLDPGIALVDGLYATERTFRDRALRTAGALGRKELLNEVRAALASDDAETSFWACWAATLLGDRDQTERLWELARTVPALAPRAVDLAARLSPSEQAHAELDRLAAAPETRRTALLGAAALGDPSRLPWLITLMREPEHARLAGAVLRAILGVDLRAAGLAADAPAKAPGPNDDPNDEQVEMSPDEPLPWPDADAIERVLGGQRWPRGTRLLAGQPLSPPWLEQVLHEGLQADRMAATLELVLMAPGTPLRDARGREL